MSAGKPTVHGDLCMASQEAERRATLGPACVDGTTALAQGGSSLLLVLFLVLRPFSSVVPHVGVGALSPFFRP